MPANTTPIYPVTPNITVGKTIQTANTAKDGTGTVVLVHTAGANGSSPTAIVFRATGTNTATVARIFVNNGADPTVATNNSLIGEVTLAATTLSEVAALADYRWSFPDGFKMPAGYKINITIGTTVAATYAITCYGGDY